MQENEFDRLVNEWMEIMVKKKVKTSTYHMYQYRIKKYIKPIFVRIEKISDANEIEQYICNLKNEKTQNNLSSQTIKSIYFLLNNFYGYLISIGKVDSNPCEKITLPRTQKRVLILLSEREVDTLMQHLILEGGSKSLLTLTGLLTGMRIGELCALTWQDVNLKNGTISIKRTKQRITKANEKSKTLIITDSPKSITSERIIPISNFLKKTLSDSLSIPSDKNRNVFTKKDGEGYDVRSIQKYYYCLTKRLRIKVSSFHCIRHTFATRAIETGIDVKTLSLILGHANISTTLNLYVHPDIKHIRNKIEKISSHLMRRVIY